MNAALGDLGVLVALVGATLLVVEGLRGARPEPARYRRGALALLSGSVVAMLALELALLTDDFSMAYVANHSATTTPFVFKVASAWAALEGSIVLWGLVLATFTWLVYRRFAAGPDRLGAGALAVMGAVALFFFGLMLTVANPFEVCIQTAGASCLASSPWPWSAAVAIADGLGPNPLLQNHILMAIHPPVLYAGYVGLTVPYAFAMSALVLREPGVEWARRTKHWTLITWSFLSLGILLGMWWSYEVLGWGGYWAWDPVENASILPWLAATAFIHSSFVQIRRGMLQAWNFVLVISAFSLTILGTFLTRSGTIASVHSFTQSAIGPLLLAFLAVVLVASFSLFALRSNLVAQSPRLESLSSREGAFLANNLLLTVI
ncbi:MAG: cytochrome c biogenesis protein CcsA, partial [Acidimicrobiia bacterium]|nr:cytochrome c biogenesis protein CcsA [Acidimicrobiia bacterium]